jgi:Skp family chaperone for outer membrane proteins
MIRPTALIFSMICISPVASATQGQIKASDVALVDVQLVFKSHAGFVDATAQLKKDFQTAQQALQEKKTKLNEEAARIKAMPAGSEARSSMEIGFAAKAASLQAELEGKKREFERREADIYAAAYQDIAEKIDVYASGHGIRLVLRHRRDPLVGQGGDKKAILADVNRTILFEDGLDITDKIIELVNTPLGDEANADP